MSEVKSILEEALKAYESDASEFNSEKDYHEERASKARRNAELVEGKIKEIKRQLAKM